MSESNHFNLVGDVMHPVGRCRSCIGTGIGHHVSPRMMQLIQDVQGLQWRLVHEHARQEFVRITPIVYDQTYAQGVFMGPFAIALDRASDLELSGFEYDEACIPIDPSWSCRDCRGTGQDGLSVDTLIAIASASAAPSYGVRGARRYQGPGALEESGWL